MHESIVVSRLLQPRGSFEVLRVLECEEGEVVDLETLAVFHAHNCNDPQTAALAFVANYPED